MRMRMFRYLRVMRRSHSIAQQAIHTLRFPNTQSFSHHKQILQPLAIAAVLSGLVFSNTNTQKSPPSEKEIPYNDAVNQIRNHILAIRKSLKIPQNYPIPKLSLSRMKKSDTIHIEMSFPKSIDIQSFLARFINSFDDSPVRAFVTDVKNEERMSLDYVFEDKSGSFHIVPALNRSNNLTFVYYKENSLSSDDIRAVTNAYEELFQSYNIAAYRRKSDFQSAQKSASKESAIRQLQSLGIEIYDVSVDERKELTWDSLAGYDAVKQEIEDTIVLALQHPEMYEEIARNTRCRYESNRPRAVLFEGPPGTGKTLTARIIAQEAGIPMIHIPIESIVSKWYGESEKKMSAIFDACDQLDGAIIFIDEVDALAGNRSGGMHEASRRILSVLLQKVEGFESAKKTTLICATNRKQDLDAALISRFDLCIRYQLPDDTTRAAVFQRYAKHLSQEDLEALGAETNGLSCRDIKEICEYTERKWASQVVKGKESGHLPTAEAYITAERNFIQGIEQEMSAQSA